LTFQNLLKGEGEIATEYSRLEELNYHTASSQVGLTVEVRVPNRAQCMSLADKLTKQILLFSKKLKSYVGINQISGIQQSEVQRAPNISADVYRVMISYQYNMIETIGKKTERDPVNQFFVTFKEGESAM